MRREPLRRDLQRQWICHRLLCRRVRRSGRRFVCLPALGGLFLFQQSLYVAFNPPRSVYGGVLDSVAAVVAGLSPLGSLPELIPQALRSVIQTAANKLLRRGLNLLL
ncbi:hypothetical protein D1159_16810 [Pseudoflavonifractor sp. 524-17]|nr:hypothetical protein [Pseudoflavonifractor sp. 524-17]